MENLIVIHPIPKEVEELFCRKAIQFFNIQPERLNPEACSHYNTKAQNLLDNGWQCEVCGAIVTRCDSLNSMET